MTIPKRVDLIEHLPLATPFSVHIFASCYCNFKCTYCLHSLSKEHLSDMGFVKNTIPVDIFSKTIDDLKMFASPLRALIFAGHGEPLLHSKIADMVKYAKEKNVAERVEITTNGSLLTPQLSDKLINAKLDRLRVSLQGLDADDYQRVCGVKINFEQFISNLEYFFQHKNSTDLFVKIIDIALDKPSATERFHYIFDSICDTAAVEYLFPFIEKIDHNALSQDMQNTKHGDGKARRINICAMPFYMLVVLPNGDVTGCCAIQPPKIFGNILQKSLYEIWNGEERCRFLETQIQDRKLNPICSTCTVPDYGMQKGDYLDEHKSRLCELFLKGEQ